MKIPYFTQLELSATQRLYSVLFLASIGLFIGGASVGWTSPATKVFKRQNGNRFGRALKGEELAWLVSLLDLGSVISPYPTSYLMDRYGRRSVIMLSACLSVLGWMLLYFADSVVHLLIARLLLGFYNGVVYLVLPVYACEAAPAHERGVACTVTSGMYCIGIMFSYVFGNLWSLETLDLMCTVAPVIYLFVVTCIPETPYYFLMKGDESEARRVCVSFDKYFSETKFQHMHACVQAEMKRSIFRDILTNPAHPFIIVVTLGMSLRFTYFWNTPSHAVFIFRFGDSNFGTGVYSIHLTLMLLLALISTVCIVRRVGRRKTTLLAESLTAMIAFPASFFFYLKNTEEFDTTGTEWGSTVLVSFLVFCCYLGLAPMPMVQQAEFFPINCRAFASALLISVSMISGSIADVMYETIASCVGLYCNYIVSGCMAVFIFLVTWLVLPEVKGISLHDIQLNVKFPEKSQKLDPPGLSEKDISIIEKNIRRKSLHGDFLA